MSETIERLALRLKRSINTKKGSAYAIPASLRADLLSRLDALLGAVPQPCAREHVEYTSWSRSDNRFFGDENNG